MFSSFGSTVPTVAWTLSVTDGVQLERGFQGCRRQIVIQFKDLKEVRECAHIGA